MAAFILKVGNQRFPTDEEFKAELPLVPLYNLRVREYALRKLENFYHGKEPIDVESFTIEHIMPQNKNLSQKWRNELGALWEEIHQKYLHTIGNLTITGYSSELGDLPFLEKRNRFFSSPLSLNHRLANLDHWDVEEIKKRASDLTNVAIQIWPFPNLASSTLEKYKGETVESSRDYTEEDHLRNGEDNTRRLYMILKDKVLQLGDSMAVNPVSHYKV